MTTKHMSWLWPDHVIGKRESRRLREEHNAVVNSQAELLEACELCVEELFQLHEQTHPDCIADRPKRCPSRAALEKARAAIAKAKGGG